MAILTQLISPALQWLTCVARRAVLLNLALLAMLCPTQASEKIDVVALVTGSIDQTRGLSSFAEMSMLCLLYTSPSPRDYAASRMPSSA